jgi:malate dehydrogenase (oxaloacetate-decarboxylating)
MAANTSIIMRIELDKAIGSFAQVAGVIAQAGGDIIAVDVIRAGKQSTIRDITVDLQGHSPSQINEAVQAIPNQ